MKNNPLDTQLKRSERLALLYLHQNERPLLASRIEKFLNNPFAFLHLNAIKYKLLRAGEVRAYTFFGSPIKVPLQDEDAALLYYSGCLGLKEYPLIRFLIKNLKPKDIFYDIGANVGFISTLAAHLGSEVHAFEPGVNILRYTRHNLRKMTLQETAVSDSDGFVTFFENEISKSGMSTGLKEAAKENNYRFSEVTVQSTKLDTYTEANPIPAMIKVDVEGFEERVIRGAQNLLSNHGPVILMEVATRPAVINASERALIMLEKLSYRPYRIQPSGEITSTHINLSRIKNSENFCFKTTRNF